LLNQVYAQAMEAWYLPLALAGACLMSLVMGLMSADSRPGFSYLKSSQKERWFPHSRKD
jgi:hypothetical protein